MTAMKRHDRFIQPYRLFFIIVLAIVFLAEVAAMYVLPMLPYHINEFYHSILDASIMVAISAPIIWLLIKKRYHAETALQDAHRRLSVLYTIDRAASQSLELNVILSNAMDATLDALGIEAGGIVLLEPDDQTLTLRIHRGLSEEFVRNLQHFNVGEGVSGRAVAERKPVVLDVSEYPTKRLVSLIIEEGFQTIAGTPLLSGGKVFGAMILGTKRINAFPPEEIELMASVGMQLGLAIQNALLYGNVQKELAERKKAEEKYRDLFDNANDAIITTDLEDRVTSWNKAAEKLFGWTAQEVTGKKLTALIVPEDVRAERDEIVHNALTGMTFTGIETVRLRKDGTKMDVSLTISPILNGDKKVIGLSGIIRDITERKRAEQELMKEKEKLESIVRGIGSGLSLLDSETRLVWANEMLQEWFGSLDVIRGKPCHLLYGIKDPQKECAALRTLQSGGIEQGEAFAVVINGEKRYFQLTTAPIKDENGRIINIVELTQDITESRRAEEALSWEAVINASLAELSTALLSQASIDNISSVVLEHAKRLTGSKFGYIGYIDLHTGYLISPTLTRDIWNACNVTDKTIIFKKFAGLWGWVLNNRKPLLTNTLANDVRSSGTPEGHVPIHRFISAPAMIGETLVGQISLANADRDYTEQDLRLIERLATIYAIALQRKQIEVELETALRDWQNTFSAIADGVFILDMEGRIVQSNGVFERMTGIKTENVIGQHCYETVHGTSDFIEDCPFKRMKQTGMRETFEFEDKERGLMFQVACDPILNESGELVNAVHIVRDITEFKKAEQTRFENIQLVLANKAKSDFLAHMSHELRTPLNSILGFSELILGNAGKLTENQRHYVDNIMASGKHLLALINDILDLSKVEAGKIDLTIEKISVPETIDEAITFVKEKAMKHNVIIKKDIDDLEIEADKQRVKQILFNLLSNAVKFSKPEGGVVTVTA